MKQGIVYSHFYPKENLTIPKKEILRYMQCKEETAEVENVIKKILPIVQNGLSLKGSFVYLPVSCNKDHICIAGTILKSSSLAKNLKDCNSAVVFALSSGINIDMLIKKHSATSTLEAFCINALATAATEEYANRFCLEMAENFKKEELYTRPRFSPGYGDLAIDCQTTFLNLTNAQRLVGITLTENYMMMPSKSVTAIMGISQKDTGCTHHNCENCNKSGCIYRR